MKEQQKHTCNCSVCGKKSSVIEEELEVLYDAYYEELEKYACRQQFQQQQQQQQEEEDTSSDDDMEEESCCSSSSDEEVGIKIKNTLTVKGNVITLADDLIKNDGRKFLEMMEKITDQKLKRERELQSEDDDDVYDEVDIHDADTEEDFDEHDDEDEELKTEEQRMEEGRKMFQVFAARMFEQRVMQAYREKVAQDRQRRLIEELEEEDRLRQERELKKQREREKKRETKRLEKLKQEQERLEMEAKKKQEEEERQRKLKELQELERKRKEEERKQKEAEKQRKEAERLRKEEEKRKREQEELERKKKEEEKKRKEEEEAKKRKEEEEEKKRKEEEERKKKEEEKRKEEKRQREEQARQEKLKQQESLNSLNTPSTTIERPRKSSAAGPIGGPIMKGKPSTVQYQQASNEHSFFTNYLFGQSSGQDNHCKSKRRISYENIHQDWTNGWTALSDAVHEKLFGDMIADRSTFILSKAKEAYLKLNEATETKYGITPSYQLLAQVHLTMNALAESQHAFIDMLELYETLNNSKSSEFECVYNQQQGYIIRLLNLRPRSSSIPAHIPSTSSSNYAFDNNNNNNTGLF
ncbi:Putative Stress response protein NST1 [Rhizopus microsporus]|nr:Putative Stress response protein NST1 [Rhizopus microsporus]